jgi:hypothetical protein
MRHIETSTTLWRDTFQEKEWWLHLDMMLEQLMGGRSAGGEMEERRPRNQQLEQR